MLATVQNNRFKSQNISFGFSPTPSLASRFAVSSADKVVWGIKQIEIGGVLVDFLFVDMLGMVIPRTYQAFNRNKEELGHPNYQAGAEEAIREILTGPSMFVIPMVFIAASKKIFGSAVKVKFDTLESFTNSFKDIASSSKIPQDKTLLKQEFYRKLLHEAFDDHKKIDIGNKININSEIENIVQNITKLESTKNNKEIISAIKKSVSLLNKSHGLNLANSHNIKLNGGLVTDITQFTTDVVNYSQDVVEKISDTISKESTVDVKNTIEKLYKKLVAGRRITLFSTVLATGAFLYAIPILYKRNKEFPGVAGLKQDHNRINTSQNFSESSTITNINTFRSSKSKIDSDFSSFIKNYNQAHTQDNTLVAFRSRQKKTNNEKITEKSISFRGSDSSVDKVFRKFDFNGHNVPLSILALYTLGIILGARLYQARDADERREVATRDFSGLMTIVFALPIFRNIISTLAKKSTGFPISSKHSQGFQSVIDHLKPRNGVNPLSLETIEDWYSGVSSYKNGIVDFSQNISDHGGDLRRIFNFLTDESKEALNTISQKFNVSTEAVKTGKIFNFLSKPFKGGLAELHLPKTNQEIIDLLKKAHADETLRPLLNTITSELDLVDNKVVKFAKMLKSIPEAASIIAISLFLGWLLPKHIIKQTRSIYKNEHGDSNTAGINLQFNQPSLSFPSSPFQATNPFTAFESF